jgi:hypothetical protein
VAVVAQAPPAEPEAPAPPAAPKAPGRPAAKPAPPAAPAPPAPPLEAGPGPFRKGETVNVRVDLRLKTSVGGNVVSDRPLTVVTVGDGSRTAIRSSSDLMVKAGTSSQNRTLGLNADVRATVDRSRILVALVLNYGFLTTAASPDQLPPFVNMNSDVRIVLEDGKALVVSDQLDAASDYRLIVEAKATVLR